MKVLMFASFPPNLGGAETRLEELCDRLTRRYPDVEIDLVTYSEYPPRIRNLGVHHFNLGTETSVYRGMKYMSLATLKGISLSRRKKYNLVYAMSIFSPGVPAALTSLVSGKRFIVHTTGTDVKPGALSVNYRMGPLFKPLTSMFQRLVIWRAETVLAEALCDCEEIQRRFPGANVTRIPIGIDTEKYAPCNSERFRVREELGLSGDDIVGMYLGTAQRRKNISYILEAARRFPHLRFIITGPREDELLPPAQVNPNCIVTGPVKDPERYLKAADYFMFPSSGEGLSNALLEALSTGLPAIVSAVGDNAVLVEHGFNGYVIDGREDFIGKVNLLASNPWEMGRMGANARSRVLEDHKWDPCIDGIYEIFGFIGECGRGE